MGGRTVLDLMATTAMVALIIVAASRNANAGFPEAQAQFSRLSLDDQALVSMALIASGDFQGLIWKGFTKRLYNAVVKYEKRSGLQTDGIVDSTLLQRMRQGASKFYGGMGLTFYTHPTSGAQLFVPRSLFEQETRTDHGFSFETGQADLSLSFVAYPSSEKSFAEVFDALAMPSATRKVTYRAIKPDYFVSSGVYKGRHYYTWMSATGASATGFTLTWSKRYRTTAPKLAMLLANTFAPLPAEPTKPVEARAVEPPSPPPRAPEPETKSSSGTGFAISYQGHVLTNYHVAGQCSNITVGRPGDLPVSAKLVAADKANDLALLKMDQSTTSAIATFRFDRGVKAGESISVYGFPLSNALAASGNIVSGNVAALAGLANDARHMQITAPVQPGNSGGPVFDATGAVVGMVDSKLDAIVTANITGDIPQNVNFAIKGGLIQSILETTTVRPTQATQGDNLDLPEIADRAKSFTFLIRCG